MVLKFSRSFHLIAVAILLCVSFAACVTQVSTSSVRALLAESASPATSNSVQIAAASASESGPATELTDKQAVDLAAELPELLAAESVQKQWPTVAAGSLPGFGPHAPPYPFLATPLRPPRA